VPRGGGGRHLHVPGTDDVDVLGRLTLMVERTSGGDVHGDAHVVDGAGDVRRERVYLGQSSSGAAFRHDGVPLGASP
jgi:hypothetical protein